MLFIDFTESRIRNGQNPCYDTTRSMGKSQVYESDGSGRRQNRSTRNS